MSMEKFPNEMTTSELVTDLTSRECVELTFYADDRFSAESCSPRTREIIKRLVAWENYNRAKTEAK